MKYSHEIAIAVLLVALCLATWRCDRNKGTIKSLSADKTRQSVISSVQVGRNGIQKRENEALEADKAIEKINSQRAVIKKAERLKTKTKKEIDDDTDNQIKGDINNLARLYKLASYSCSVR